MTPPRQNMTERQRAPRPEAQRAVLTSLGVALSLVFACDGAGTDAADAGTDGSGDSAGGDTATPDTVDGDGGSSARDAITALPVDTTRTVAALSAPVHIVRTQMHVPHIYAANEADLYRAAGFVMAQDRYFEFELGSRLALGTLSELLGDLTLSADVESRGTGMAAVADRLLAAAAPESRALLDAYAAGVNAWQAALRGGAVDPPTELGLVGPLLGVSDPVSILKPVDARSVAGFAAFVVFTSSHSFGDLVRDDVAAAASSFAPAGPRGDLRRAGLMEDILGHIAPVFPVSATPPAPDRAKRVVAVPPSLVSAALAPASRARVRALAARRDLWLRRGRSGDFGSNVWAVSAAGSADGTALLAGDGHLSLGIPPVFMAMGLDDTVFGDGDTAQVGLFLPGFPLLGVGTNGAVAWSQTYPRADLTDYYREELQLGDDGLPSASRFGGAWHALRRTDERFEVAGTLGAASRVETWPRWETFDGRWLIDVEGTPAGEDAPPPVAFVLGSRIVPGDVDGDGAITAISMDYTGFDIGDLVGRIDALGHARSTQEFDDVTRGFVGYAQNLGAADREGQVLLTSYTATPCRDHLTDLGRAPGADPTGILDGTRFGGFTIPLGEDGVPREGDPDPTRCVIPFDDWPRADAADAWFVANANNDPAGLSFDGDLFNGPHYLGGPWDVGARADTITARLSALVGTHAATIDAMAELQGDHTSRTGQLLAPFLIDAIDRAEALAADPGGSDAELRLVSLWASARDPLGEARARLAAWLGRGAHAESGVATFYEVPDETDREDAVATMIFNTWLRRYTAALLDDEGITFAFEPAEYGRARRLTLLRSTLLGRGADNPEQLASWDPATGESVYFDDARTEVVETSDEVILAAAIAALEALATPPRGADGGFGTTDMSGWLWGLRHRVRFESILTGFASGNPVVGLLAADFSISTERLPLAADLLRGDPRAALDWFPRPGDAFAVDAATPAADGADFDYVDGPVMRMVIALGPGGVRGQNVLPGGQSGIVASPHFDDQVRLWLANDTIPILLDPLQVAAAASSHELLVP